MPWALQVAPHGGVRGHRRGCAVSAGLAGHAQVVQVQLRRPAGMLAVLERQRRDGHRRQAREAALVAAQSVLERGHRIGGAPGPVVPALRVDAPKRTSRPETGWRQVLAASARNAAPNCRGAGGAAISGPMIEKRRRAHRSRSGGSAIVFNAGLQVRPHRRCDLTEAKAMEPRRARLRASSAGAQPASCSLIAAGLPTARP